MRYYSAFHAVTVEIEVKYFSYGGSFFDILNVVGITGFLTFNVFVTKSIVTVENPIFSTDKLSGTYSL